MDLTLVPFGYSVSEINSRFFIPGASKGCYRAILEDFISHDVTSKSWINHPRSFSAEQLARSRLAKEVVDAELLYKKRTEELRSRLDFDDKLLDQIKS